MGEADREGGVVLAAVDRADPRPVDLGDVAGVGDGEREGAEERRVGPPLLNDFVALQKDVALISIIGPQEAFRVAQIFQGENFNYTPIIAAALLYLVITVPLARIVDRMGGEGYVR